MSAKASGPSTKTPSMKFLYSRMIDPFVGARDGRGSGDPGAGRLAIPGAGSAGTPKLGFADLAVLCQRQGVETSEEAWYRERRQSRTAELDQLVEVGGAPCAGDDCGHDLVLAQLGVHGVHRHVLDVRVLAEDL